MDFSSYRPAPEVLKRLEQVTFTAVVGLTAVGKTTLIREASTREPSLHMVINNTSRDARPDEREGFDFRFETRAYMEERIARHEYVQVAPNLFGDLYATAAEDYPTDGVCVLPVLADAMPAFRALPFKSVRSVYILPPDWETWQQRLIQHQFNADKLMQRLAEGKRSLQYALDDVDTQFVINDDLPTAIEDFITLAFGRPINERLQADQEKAPELVRNLLKQVEQATIDPAIVLDQQ
jgi:guanylate kinase